MKFQSLSLAITSLVLLGCVVSSHSTQKRDTMQNATIYIKDIAPENKEIDRIFIKEIENSSSEIISGCREDNDASARYKFKMISGVGLEKYDKEVEYFRYLIFVEKNDAEIYNIKVSTYFNIHGNSDVYVRIKDENFKVKFPWLVDWRRILLSGKKCD